MTDESLPIRVVVVDDQDIVRDGLVTVLSLLADIDVVGEATNGREATEVVDRVRPDVVLMDLRMPVLDGAGATELIVNAHPEIAVLVLTTYDDDDSIARALAAGARGYLTKDASGRTSPQPCVRSRVVRRSSTRRSRRGSSPVFRRPPLFAKSIRDSPISPTASVRS